MFYPRHKEEMAAVRLFFQSSEEESCNNFLPDTDIHVGYRIQRPSRALSSATFVSVDEKMTISWEVNKDLFVRLNNQVKTFFIFEERGPVLCATKLAYLKGCLPRLLRRYTVCSLDFN